MVKVGDKIRITRFSGEACDELRTVDALSKLGSSSKDFYIDSPIVSEDGYSSCYFDADDDEYTLVEECAEVTAKDCSPAVFDMLSALSQEVAVLKRQLTEINDQVDTLYHNQFKQAERLEVVWHRTQATPKSKTDLLTDAFNALKHYKEVVENDGI
jgi:hypothetical protein